MTRAFAQALHLAKLAQCATRLERRRGEVKVVRVELPRPVVVGAGLARRPAEQAPLVLRPVSIFRPLAEDVIALKEFVRGEFVEASKKRETRRG